jgi:hypothetical protein
MKRLNKNGKEQLLIYPCFLLHFISILAVC